MPGYLSGLTAKLTDPYRGWFEENGGLKRFEKKIEPFVDKGYELTSSGLLMQRDRGLVGPSGGPISSEKSDAWKLILTRPTSIHHYNQIEEIVELIIGTGNGYVYFNNPKKPAHPELAVNDRRPLRPDEQILLSGETPCAWVPHKGRFVGIYVMIIGGTIDDLDGDETSLVDFDKWDPYAPIFTEKK